MSIIVVTGTDTGVGKTVVTAALAALAADRGWRVAVVKPAQTGVLQGEPGDLDDVRRLSGVDDLHEYVRYPDPLSPAAAARRHGAEPLHLERAAEEVAELAESRHLVLVEGAGGLLVRFDPDGHTIVDLAHLVGAPLVVVARAGLGTLNHTALTLEAMAGRGVEPAGVVIGSWPDDPDLAMRSNIDDLETLAARPLAGALPAGSGSLPAGDFLETARAALAPSLGGTFDPGEFRTAHDPTRGER